MRLGTAVTFDEVNNLAADDELEERVLVGSTLFGLAMFTTLFLGTVLGVFLTLGAVATPSEGCSNRSSSGRWKDQPAARPLRRCGAGVRGLRDCRLRGGEVITADGDWWPDDPIGPGAGLVLAVLVIAALSLLVLFLPRPQTASRSSCSLAPGSRRACSARSATRSRCRR